jgi:hypothetical protein
VKSPDFASHLVLFLQDCPSPDATVTVQDENVVDIVSINEARSAVVLTVSDHLDWSDTERHQTVLQTKLNRYLAFVESGELLERHPASKGLAVVFVIVFKFKPDRKAEAFLSRAKETVKSAGFSLKTEVFAESYEN